MNLTPEIWISARVQRAMLDHCVALQPEEAGGLLVGRFETGEVTRWVVEYIVPLENVWPTPEERDHRICFDPRAQLEVEASARLQKCSLIGSFHSHPTAIAEPSAIDLEWAWDAYAYVIVSLTPGAVCVRGWALDSATKRFIECKMCDGAPGALQSVQSSTNTVA